MIPSLVAFQGSPWRILPPGVHHADFREIERTFAINSWRRDLFAGFLDACQRLRSAGCARVFLDGSYVTAKPTPGDYDACWDPNGVVLEDIDPVFLDFEDGCSAQKAIFKGEFYPSTLACANVNQAFVKFFQIDRFTGNEKGILCISLPDDPVFVGGVHS